MISRDIYLNKLIKHKDNELIKVITGIRRCGKSTLLKLYENYLINNKISNKQIIFINFELMEFDQITNYKLLYSYIKDKINNNEKYYIFLDEIQKVKNWEKAVTSLNIDSNVDIYITGSNAYLLSSELSTLLSGRYVEIKMLPLSFKEFLSSKHLDSKNLSLNNIFQEYLKFGSFPTITNLPQDEEIINDYLNGILDTILIKDVISRNNINNINLINNILKYIVSNTGNTFSPKSISNFLNHHNNSSINSNTISNYVTFLEKAFIIYKAPRYNIKGKEILKTLSKYYVIDIGIRNMILGYSDSDKGHVLETIVYFELLRRGYQVFVGKYYNNEVDFVAIKKDKIKYYQVTLTIMDKNVKERELKPLKAISDNYEKILLSMDKTFITDYNGIIYQNIIDFLLE
ncbi:MAG: ATP-binding protein [Methanobacteriaceae archaeon]|nr:ATP-binding protein [Methanobacteriaceae archaeon]